MKGLNIFPCYTVCLGQSIGLQKEERGSARPQTASRIQPCLDSANMARACDPLLPSIIIADVSSD
jgi:hypothetical protein